MTRQIELSKQGKHRGKYIAIVDDSDFESVSKFRWAVAKTWKGLIYATRSENGKTIYMHRFILGIDPDMFIDHRDGDGLNNTRCNLRIASPSDNSHNQKARRSDKFKGVYKNGNRYMAKICVNRTSIYIGNFKNQIDAARAYNEAALKYHGEFARLNVIID